MATNGAAAEKASSATCPGNGGDVWRLARNSGAFRVVWLRGRIGGASVSRVHEGPACHSSVHGYGPARIRPCAKGEALVFMPLNRNCSLPVDKSIDLAAPEAVLKGCKGDRPVTVHRSGDVRFFTESVDKYVNSAQASWEDPVFMRILRVLPKF